VTSEQARTRNTALPLCSDRRFTAGLWAMMTPMTPNVWLSILPCGMLLGAEQWNIRKFVEIAMQLWYYATRIEQERLNKNVQACRNAVYEVKWKISVYT
jgi:hypothetical protein